MRLENKVALISGAARGMGAVEAKMFAAEGAKVVIGDLLGDEGRQVEAEINESGGECVFVQLDVTDESAWHDAVAAAVDRFGTRQRSRHAEYDARPPLHVARSGR